MSDITIDFKVSKNEAALVYGVLSNFYRNSSNVDTRESLGRILREIRSDVKIDDVIFGKLANAITPVAKARVRRSSNLEFQLGLKVGYRRVALPKICNGIAKQLVRAKKPGKAPKRILSASIMKATKVSDLVALIKGSYNAAK